MSDQQLYQANTEFCLAIGDLAKKLSNLSDSEFEQVKPTLLEEIHITQFIIQRQFENKEIATLDTKCLDRAGRKEWINLLLNCTNIGIDLKKLPI